MTVETSYGIFKDEEDEGGKEKGEEVEGHAEKVEEPEGRGERNKVGERMRRKRIR